VFAAAADFINQITNQPDCRSNQGGNLLYFSAQPSPTPLTETHHSSFITL
jgi:hypothetical protein